MILLLRFLTPRKHRFTHTHALKANDGLNSKCTAKIIYWILDEDINTFDVYTMTCALPGSILSILKWTETSSIWELDGWMGLEEHRKSNPVHSKRKFWQTVNSNLSMCLRYKNGDKRPTQLTVIQLIATPCNLLKKILSTKTMYFLEILELQ